MISLKFIVSILWIACMVFSFAYVAYSFYFMKKEDTSNYGITPYKPSHKPKVIERVENYKEELPLEPCRNLPATLEQVKQKQKEKELERYNNFINKF